jgi:hypothetical protein
MDMTKKILAFGVGLIVSFGFLLVASATSGDFYQSNFSAQSVSSSAVTPEEFYGSNGIDAQAITGFKLKLEFPTLNPSEEVKASLAEYASLPLFDSETVTWQWTPTSTGSFDTYVFRIAGDYGVASSSAPTSTFVFDPTKYYSLSVSCVVDCGGAITIRTLGASTSSNPIPNAAFLNHFSNTTSTVNANGISDMYVSPDTSSSNFLSVALSFPTSTDVVPNFQNWTTFITGLTSQTISNFSSNNGEVGVVYSQSLYPLTHPQFSQYGILNITSGMTGDVNGGIYYQVFGVPDTLPAICVSAGSGSQDCTLFADGGIYSTVEKSVNLAPSGFATSTVWYAMPYLRAGFGNFPLYTFGEIVSFTVSQSASIPADSTSTIISAPFGAQVVPAIFVPGTEGTSTYTIDCSAYSGFFLAVSVAGLECYGEQLAFNVTQFIFVPHEQTTQFLASAFASFKGVFPFNLFYSFSDTVIAASNATSSGNYDLVLHVPLAGQMLDLPVLTSSTVSNVVGSSSTAEIFIAEGNVMYFLTAFSIFAIIF